MGAELSCDICQKTLDENSDYVYEQKNANPEHICLQCFDSEKYVNYNKRSVYNVVGEENARRLNESEENREKFREIASGFVDAHPCECGAATVRRPDVKTCFNCGKSIT